MGLCEPRSILRPHFQTIDTTLDGLDVTVKFEIITGEADCGLPGRYAKLESVTIADGEDILDSLTTEQLNAIEAECEEADPND